MAVLSHIGVLDRGPEVIRAGPGPRDARLDDLTQGAHPLLQVGGRPELAENEVQCLVAVIEGLDRPYDLQQVVPTPLRKRGGFARERRRPRGAIATEDQ